MRSAGAGLRGCVRLAVLALVAIGTTGASPYGTGHPIPMRVQAGSTILLRLGPDYVPLSPSGTGSETGFGSEVTKREGEWDDQRGELFFYLRAPANGTHTESYRLLTRYVTRVHPHPTVAEPYAADGQNSYVLAVVDVPAHNASVSTSVPTGNDPGCPNGPSVSSATTYELVVRRAWRQLSPALESTTCPGASGPDYKYESFSNYFASTGPKIGPHGSVPSLTVIPGSGSATPAEAYLGDELFDGTDLDADLLSLVPYPQAVINLDLPSSGGAPAAADLTVSYPTSLVTIKDVVPYESRRDRASIRWWDSSPAGTLRISMVSPGSHVPDIGIVFELTGTSDRAEITDFTVQSSTLHASDGTEGGTAVLVGIR